MATVVEKLLFPELFVETESVILPLSQLGSLIAGVNGLSLLRSLRRVLELGNADVVCR